MVEPATSLGRSGLQDWLIQRISAVILAVYTIFLAAYLILHSELSFEVWRGLFATNLMRYGSGLALLCLVAHAWIGIWTVIKDYIKPTIVRLLVLIIVAAALIVYFVWGLRIFWGI